MFPELQGQENKQHKTKKKKTTIQVFSVAGCRKPGRPSLECRSMCVATALWVAAWFSLGLFTCEMGSQSLASSQSCQLPVFFLIKFYWDKACSLPSATTETVWPMEPEMWPLHLQKNVCQSLVCGAAAQTENDVTQSLVYGNCFHYIIIQVGKRLRSHKLERKCFNC